jgi:hypothetical protein
MCALRDVPNHGSIHRLRGVPQFGDRIGTENGCRANVRYSTCAKSDSFHKETDGPSLLAGYVRPVCPG